jgi:peroxiredoxin
VRSFLLAVFVLLGAAPFARAQEVAPVASSLKVGDAAPAFTARDHEDKEVRLADFKGKRVVLWFYPKADTGG